MPLLHILRPRSVAILVACILCNAALCSLASAQSSAKPFSKDDVVQLLKGSVSAKRVGELAQNRGINFQVTPEVEGELREAGATDELLATLRRLAPKTTTLVIESSPGGAHVYVDDEPMGTTSAEGRLKLTTLSPSQHRVRLSLDGYKDDSKDVALAVGAVLELKVTLEAKEPPVSSGTAAKVVEPNVSRWADTSAQRDSQAVVYVFQRNLRFGVGVGSLHPEVLRDGVSLGQLSSGRYFTLRLLAGKYSFTSTDHQSHVELNAQDGGVYYIEVSMGTSSRGRLYGKAEGKLTLVSNEIGEAEIKKLKPR